MCKYDLYMINDSSHTVNSEIFARVYFRETSHKRSFVKIKSSRTGEIILSFTDIGKSRSCCEISTSQICVLTLFAKNNFLEKISKLTVPTSDALEET